MIDRKKYNEICSICDSLLKDNDSSIQRVSISWLHVIREHPIILKRYEELFTKNSLSKFIKSSLISFINYLRFLYNLICSINKNIDVLEAGRFEDSLRVDYLFVSHLIDYSHLNNNFDFYFGNIIQNVEAANLNTITLLINQTKIPSVGLKTKYLSSQKKIFLTNCLNFKDEIKLFFQLWKESKILKFKLKKLKYNNLKSKVIKEASRQCLSPTSFDNLRRYYQFKKIIGKYKPRNIVSTFEGHAWERILFFAAKNNSLSIKCIGYQHTSLFRFQHSALRKLKTKYNPDVILTTGHASMERFKNSDIGFDKKIAILGSNRGKDVISIDSNINMNKNSCIVIPEGFDTECLILFRFSLECSKIAPEINFIFKLHPIMNKELFVKKYPEFKILPNNIKWASDDILFDFSQCKWALYRGTTMIVQAIYAGLIPLYLKSKPEEMTLDLLDKVSDYKSTLISIEDFKLNTLDTIHSSTDREHVLNYCSNLYSEFDYKVLLGVSNLSN